MIRFRPVTSGMIALLIAVLVGVALPVGAGARGRHPRRCANIYARINAVSRPAIRGAVVCLVNRERRERGLPPLIQNSRLDRSAQGWTDTMVAHDIFEHGSDFSARISAVGVNWATVGENIATGYPTPASVVAAWMASTGHCQNILDPEFSEIGIGALPRGIRPYGSRPGSWTQDFALPMGHRPPSENFRPADGCPYG